MPPKEKKETAAISTDVLKYNVKIKTLADMLGTAPNDPKLYSDFIVAKALTAHQYKAKTKTEKDEIRKAINDHELSLLPGNTNASALEDVPDSVKDILAVGGDGIANAVDQKGKTVYRRNANGLVMLDFQLKGFCKAAGKAVSNMFQPESRIDKWLFCGPREIPIMRDGEQVKEPEGESVRPLRIEDKMTGVSRTAIAVSEIVLPGVTMDFELLILPKGFSSKSTGGQFKKEEIRMWVEYGLYSGLGAHRSASFGAFDIISFEEAPISWAESLDFRRKQLQSVFSEELSEALLV